MHDRPVVHGTGQISVQVQPVDSLGEERGSCGDIDETIIVHDDVRKAFATYALDIKAIRATRTEDKKFGYLGRDPKFQLFSSPNKKLLVLDIDRTLAFYAEEVQFDAVEWSKMLQQNGEPQFVLGRQPTRRCVWLRPYLKEFLVKCHCIYDLIVFSASSVQHVMIMQPFIDPAREYIKRYFTKKYTTQCKVEKVQGVVQWATGLKDMTFLLETKGQQNVVIIDDNITAIALHLENAIPVPEFLGDQEDSELRKVLPFLELLAMVPDATVPIRDRYGFLWEHLVQL